VRRPFSAAGTGGATEFDLDRVTRGTAGVGADSFSGDGGITLTINIDVTAAAPS
jgi:hypothetical protein